MALRVIGAGVGRTGTTSLKLALERLLGAPCYHMLEVFEHDDHVPMWHRAGLGDMPDWHALYDGYVATVDWPAASFWPELADAFPDAVVLLSTRESAKAWWASADRTVFDGARRGWVPENRHWWEMFQVIARSRFTNAFDDPEACMAAYDAHNEAVRAAVPAGRLVEWQPGDGWGPLCRGLGVPVPDEPFPHVNTTEEFRTRSGWE